MNETKQIASLLREVANLYSFDDATVAKIQEKWPDFLPEVSRVDLPPVAGVTAASWPEPVKHLMAFGQLTRLLWFGVPDPEAAEKTQRILFFVHDPEKLGIDWKSRKITYTPSTILQKVLYFLIQHVDRAKRCANMECTRPLFIATKPNERYCSQACSDNAQRLAKINWWKENGAEWRKAKKSSRRKR
jgi:hypothetical protein